MFQYALPSATFTVFLPLLCNNPFLAMLRHPTISIAADRVVKSFVTVNVAYGRELGMVFKTPVKPEWCERGAPGTMAS